MQDSSFRSYLLVWWICNAGFVAGASGERSERERRGLGRGVAMAPFKTLRASLNLWTLCYLDGEQDAVAPGGKQTSSS